MAREKVIIDQELLRRLYVDERKSIPSLAARFDCTTRTVAVKLRRYGIPVRGPSELRIGATRSPEQRRRISRSCRRGPNHHKWKGGKRTENKKARECVEYRLWREEVYQRDNWTCIFCQKRGGELEADHIKRFADYPELRYEPTNGRTLCVACHKHVTAEQNKQPKRDARADIWFSEWSPHQ